MESNYKFIIRLTGGRSGCKLDGQKDAEISLLPLFEKLGVK